MRTSTRFSTTSMALHGVGALLVLSMTAAGFVMTDLPRDGAVRLLLSRMHTVGGVALMLVTLARAVARARGPNVEPLPLPRLHLLGVRLVHVLMYGVTFGVGLSGAVTGALSAWPEYLRGRLASAPALGALASRDAHEWMVFALLALVLVHLAGVVRQEVRSGGVLRRMLPFLTGG